MTDYTPEHESAAREWLSKDHERVTIEEMARWLAEREALAPEKPADEDAVASWEAAWRYLGYDNAPGDNDGIREVRKLAHFHATAREQGRHAGAEQMREACAQAVYEMAKRAQADGAYDAAGHLEAAAITVATRPIPEPSR